MPTTRITIDTKSLNIPWVPGETYRVEAEEGAFLQINPDVQPNGLLTNVFSFTTNTTAPVITSSDPQAGNLNVTKGYEIEIIFDRYVEHNTAAFAGTIRLYEVSSTDILLRAYTAENLNYHDNKVYLDTFDYLQPNKSYYILIDTNAIRDYDGLLFAGISSKSALSFTTDDVPDFKINVETYMTKVQGEGLYKTNDFTQLITNTPTITNNISDSGDETLEYTLSVEVLNNQIVQEIKSGTNPGYKFLEQISSPIGQISTIFSTTVQACSNSLVAIQARFRHLYLYSLSNGDWNLFQTILGAEENGSVRSVFSIDTLTLIVSYPTASIPQVKIYTRPDSTSQFTLFQTINIETIGIGITPDNSIMFLQSSVYKKINNIWTNIQSLGIPDSSSSNPNIINNNKVVFVDRNYKTAFGEPELGRAYIYERLGNDTFNLVQTITGPNSTNFIDGSFSYEDTLYIEKYETDIDVYQYNSLTSLYELETTFTGFGSYDYHFPNIIEDTGKVYILNGTSLEFVDNIGSINFERITPDRNYAFNSVASATDVYFLAPDGNLSWDSNTSTLTLEGNRSELNSLLGQLAVRTNTSIINEYDGEIKLEYNLITPSGNSETRIQRIYRVN